MSTDTTDRTTRFVDERLLRRRLEKALGDAADSGDARSQVAAFGSWLRRQPALPTLVGATRAAEILGVKAPHIARLKAQGRMPEPVAVEGGNEAYLLSEVLALAKTLNAERAAKRRTPTSVTV